MTVEHIIIKLTTVEQSYITGLMLAWLVQNADTENPITKHIESAMKKLNTPIERTFE